MTTNDPTTSNSGASSRGSHQLATSAECKRKWAFHYRKKLKILGEPKFRLGGTLIHSSLAILYGQRLIDNGGKIPDWWKDESLDVQLAKEGAGYPELIQYAREIYDAYEKMWWQGAAAEPWEPTHVEEEFRATVGELDPGGEDRTLDSEVVTCRTDLVVRHKDTGHLWIVDHKTKGGGYGGKGADRLPAWGDGGEYALSWQANINLHLIRLRLPHENVRGFIVNRVKRMPPYDFDRHILHVSPEVYKTVPSVVRAQVATEREIDQMLAAGKHPPPSYWTCMGRFGWCDYISICNADTVDERNSVIESKFKVG